MNAARAAKNAAPSSSAAHSGARAVAPAGNLSQWIAIIALPVIAFLVGGVFLPRPDGAGDARKPVDRGALSAVVTKTKPVPKKVVEATLGGVRLLGVDLPTEKLGKGSSIKGTLYFETVSALTRDWTVFVHIDGKNAEFRIHGEHPPVGGQFPTTLWESGDFIVDKWDARVPLDAPPGTYTVWVGFYEGDDRLPFAAGEPSLHDGSNRVKVGTVVIE